MTIHRTKLISRSLTRTKFAYVEVVLEETTYATLFANGKNFARLVSTRPLKKNMYDEGDDPTRIGVEV